MPQYIYKAIPAQRKGEKARGTKTSEARAALTLETQLNAMAEDGWEYVRADLIPMEERAGLTSKSVNYHTVLIFRRERGAQAVSIASQAAATSTPLDQDTAAATKPRKSPVADRHTPPPSVPFPSHPEKGAGANARHLSPDVADEIAEDRES